MVGILSFTTSPTNFGVINNNSNNNSNKTLSSSSSAVSLKSSSQITIPNNINLHQHYPPLFVPEVESAVDTLYPEFRAVDNLVARNTSRVLKAFQNARVGSHHFGGCTGYGHEEAGGREALDQAFAEIFGAESAIVRSQFFSGTHAITCALFAFLRPGDELLAVAGAPYDTLEEVIGIRDGNGLGSLKDFGIKYREVALADDGGLDWDALEVALKPETKCALIQRSCGYSWRKSLSVTEISRAIDIIKLFVVIVPIVGLGALIWWASRDMIEIRCRNCENEFEVFKSMLNDEPQLCPYCNQPFSVVGDQFVRDRSKSSKESTPFDEAFNDLFSRSKQGKASSRAVIDVEAEVKDVE